MSNNKETVESIQERLVEINAAKKCLDSQIKILQMQIVGETGRLFPRLKKKWQHQVEIKSMAIERLNERYKKELSKVRELI